MTQLSILDLSPVTEGSTARDALHNSGDLAAYAEQLGYKRFWMAEHHSMPGIASAATAVGLAYVGAGTSTIRIGAGGSCCPTMRPWSIAEQFGTLEVALSRAGSTSAWAARPAPTRPPRTRFAATSPPTRTSSRATSSS